jgi:hypothetical protein
MQRLRDGLIKPFTPPKGEIAGESRTFGTATSVGGDTVCFFISEAICLVYTDPDGKWVDNGDGTFTAEKGDTLWGLQQDTGKSWTTSDYNGDPKKLQIGQVVSFAVKNESNNYATVDSTKEAWSQYINGDGSPVNIGPHSINTLKTHPEQLKREDRIRSGQTEALTGNYGVDLTFKKGTFHIGNTRVDYSTTHGRKFAITDFSAFTEDGFWDLTTSKGDRAGPKGEIFWGKPYPYVPHRWTISYPNLYK